MVAAVGGLKKHTEVATVVWDGASGHRNEWVRELGMPLIVLPPYSSELNPVERVFEEVRRAIEGKAYATLEDKMTAVAEFLTHLESDPERVRSLTCGTGLRPLSGNSQSLMRRDQSHLVSHGRLKGNFEFGAVVPDFPRIVLIFRPRNSPWCGMSYIERITNNPVSGVE
jgi:hypothetical protein